MDTQRKNYTLCVKIYDQELELLKGTLEEIDDFICFRTANRWLRWYVDDCIVCSCQKKMMLGMGKKENEHYSQRI